MPAKNVRSEVLRTLVDFRKRQTLRTPGSLSNEQDQRFYTQVLKGIFRQRNLLDQVITRHLHKEITSLQPAVLEILRLGTYDLLFMRTPDHAAVHEAVNLCHGPQRGLVNAVLRKVSLVSMETPSHLQLHDVLPVALARRWQEILPERTHETVAQVLQKPAPLALRVNSQRTSRETLMAELQEMGAQVRASSYLPWSILADQLPPLAHLKCFQQGHFYVQNQASQVPVYLLDPQPGEFILDACAAPGGKTTQIAEHAQNQAHIIALDPNSTALERMHENVQRLGARGIETVCADLLHYSLDPPRLFDRILLDAPCSGWGILREHPEWRWVKDAQAPQECAKLQRELLKKALTLLKPSGVLVYSVCTFSPEETWQVLKDQTRQNPAPFLPRSLASFIVDEAVSITPEQEEFDGFFVARLQRSP